jgi:hypothetical protein
MARPATFTVAPPVAPPPQVGVCHVRIYLRERDNPLHVSLTPDSYRTLADAFRHGAPGTTVITLTMIDPEGRHRLALHLRLDEVQAVIEEAPYS